MKKLTSMSLHKCYEVLYGACLCTGIIVASDCYFKLSWPHIMLAVLALLFQTFLFWSEEKGLRIQLWTTTAVLALLGGILWSKSGRDIENYYFYLSIAAVCLAVSVVCYLARRRLWLKAPLTVISLGCLIFFSLKSVTMPKWTVCILLFCFLLFLAEAAEKNSVRGAGKNALYLFPILLLAVLLMLRLPVRETPIRWNAIKNMVRTVSEKVTTFFVDVGSFFSGGDGAYTMSFAGYNTDGALGGSINGSDKPQLKLEGGKTGGPLYLEGSIYNTYTGHGWEREAGEKPYEAEEYTLQFKEMEAAFKGSIYTEEEIRKLRRYQFYEIEYKKLRTESLFTAPITEKLVFSEGGRLSEDPGDSLLMTKAKGTGFSYNLNFLEVDYTSEKVQRLLRQQAWKESPVPDSVFLGRQAYIHENYTKLPDTVPERVYELADEITAGAQTDYDRLKAIEAWLNRYAYSTNARLGPEEQDFTDYFLFESKTGYCTYFATAMAVLGRCEGIPTRYVEGFVTSETRGGGSVILTGNNAHAWTEAYIDNIGWIPFEPTPGYSAETNREWARPVHVRKNPAPKEEKAPEPVKVEAPKEPGFMGKNGQQILFIGLELLLMVALLLGVAAAFIAVRRSLRRHAYQNSEGYHKIAYQMRRIFHFGKRYGFLLEDGETLSDYDGRLKGRLDTTELTFGQICALFEEIRFGGRPVTDTETNKMEHYVEMLEREYLKSCGRMRKVLYYIQ